MNIFDSYTQRVRSSIQQEKAVRGLQKSSLTFSSPANQVKAIAGIRPAVRQSMEPECSLLTLNDLIGKADLSDARIGMHPDFRHLIGTEETAMHYITSAFIDIKGSTRLHDSYELDTVCTITNTIESAAIHVCHASIHV